MLKVASMNDSLDQPLNLPGAGDRELRGIGAEFLSPKHLVGPDGRLRQCGQPTGSEQTTQGSQIDNLDRVVAKTLTHLAASHGNLLEQGRV